MAHIITKEEEVIDLEEEKQEKEDVVKDLKTKHHGGRLTEISTQFDAGGKGYLTQTEQNARKLANKDGSIDPDAAIKLMKSHDKLIIYLKIISGLVFFLFVAIVVMGVSLGKGISNTGQNTQASIAESVHTKVEVGPMGASHLLDTQGNEITVRGDGDSFVAITKFDAVTGRRLNCLPIEDVAVMVSDISKGTQGSVIVNDEDGHESEILSIAGNYQDKNSFLQFDSFRVILDDDSCQKAVGTPIESKDIGTTLEDAVTFEEKNKVSEEEDPKEEQGDILNRHLRHIPSQAATDDTISVEKSQVLSRNRDAYTKARTALRDGRKLQSERTELTIDFGCQTYGGACVNEKSCCFGLTCVISADPSYVGSSSRCTR